MKCIRFISRFARGLTLKRYDFRREQLHSLGALIAGTVLSSIPLVLHGIRSWQEADSRCSRSCARWP